MRFAAGTRLGAYELCSILDTGGMGEVYRARDTRLGREVAIKVLPDAFASDPGRRRRFEREARAVSSLNHPHICSLYDVGFEGGAEYLVMELIEGESLATRLIGGALPTREALRWGIEIADALSAAHRAGIVHRDLKPSNVMLTATGAKLLDFGVAAISTGNEAVDDPTLTSLTGEGAIVGTLAYMAPEQVESRPVDARTDIFAFGALAYEMVTGRKAFEGRSHASLAAAILEHEPPALTSLQPAAPLPLDHIVAKCLAKSPDDRWQSARDLATELKWLASAHATGDASSAPATAASFPRRLARLGVSAAAIIGIIVVASTLVENRPSHAPTAGVVRSIVTTLPADHLRALSGDETTNEGYPSRTSMAWSPDGKSIAFSASRGGKQQLYLRALDQLEAVPIPATDDASTPFFSPDGQWIGFFVQKHLRKVGVTGGPPIDIGDAVGIPSGADWGDDGTIVYASERDGVWHVSATGGIATQVAKPAGEDREAKQLLPRFLPGSKAILFTTTHARFPTWDDTEVIVQNLSGSRLAKLESAADGRYVASGHVVYMRRGTLMAAPFDLATLQFTGSGVSVLAGVRQSANTPNDTYETGAGQFAVSSVGSLLYVPGGIFPDPERTVVWVTRAGKEEPLPMPLRAYSMPRLSPDGKLITMWTQGDRNTWIYDLARRALTRVSAPAPSTRSIWSPDGKRIALSSTAGGAEENPFVVSVAGDGGSERLVSCDCSSYAVAWTPDGGSIVGVERIDNNYDIVLIEAAGTHRKTPLLHSKTANEYYPDISPDGRWIAYASNETGNDEVYVQRFPDLGQRQQISIDGGAAPVWSRDGRELFYLKPTTTGGQAGATKVMAVAVTTQPTFVASAPRMLFEGRYGASSVARPFDVAPDGRFLMVTQKDRAPMFAPQMVLVQNWLEELKARVPTK